MFWDLRKDEIVIPVSLNFEIALSQITSKKQKTSNWQNILPTTELVNHSLMLTFTKKLMQN